MKNKFYNWLFKIALKVISINIIKYGNQLTPDYLIKKGWMVTDGIYTEPGVKDRDLISIQFEKSYYRVWHGSRRVFIALECTIEWFEAYYLIIHPDNR